jgi:hypothetical protein
LHSVSACGWLLCKTIRRVHNTDRQFRPSALSGRLLR